jgi:two-component system, cell cycle sensor histidine kinase and response regulator CckA
MSNTEMNSDDIRRRAEAIAAEMSKDTASLSPEVRQNLLHELQVHQIELEMQNEELRRTQLALEASRARYFDLYDLAPVGYVTLSEKGIIREANLTLVDLLGLTRKEVMRRPFTHFILPADQDIFYQHRRQLFDSDTPQLCKLRLLRANGEPFWAQLEGKKVQNAAGEPSGRIIVSDITSQKQAEEALQAGHQRLEETIAELRQAQAQLVQQERLAAVGQLAAGIAHDFNNILAVITLYIDLSLHNPNLPPALQDRLEVVRRQTKRATHLVQQILDFGRRAVLQTRSLALVLFLQEQVDLWRRTIPESIKIYFQDETTSECVIHADPTRLQQLFTNLVLNARDVMPDGGELCLSLKQFRLENNDTPPLPNMAAGDWVEISVSDTGTGIPAATLPHVFEPFFTSKEPGMGSGLGLAQVYGIVKQHQGHIDVQTEAGRGTTFTIYLPALTTALPRATAVTPTAPLQGHGETILIVEDNEVLREALAGTLAALNYRVLTAANGRQALAILERQAGSEPDGEAAVALVLSDLVMPEMGGAALFQALRQRGLTVPVMILSGHPMVAELQALQAQGLAGWLLKPIGTAELAAAVARALSRIPQLGDTKTP